jgi:cobalt-zinc-cadmium resistance protein CzcA
MLQGIIEFSLKHRLIVVLSVLVLVLLGIAALGTSPKEFLPDLSSPIVSVMTEKLGLAPQEVENLITRPIENNLQSLPNVLNIRSSSTSGLSIVTITFKWGTDYYLARQLIAQSLADVIPKLPAGTNPPFLSNAASRLGEVIQYYLKSDSLSLMDLRELADYDVRLRLQGVPGVSRINNVGGEVRQLQVLVDLDKLRYYNIGLNEITEALHANNLNFSGGVIPQGPIEFSVRGLGRLYTIKDLSQVVITTRNGVPIYLRDVAALKEGPQFRRGIVYMDGKEAVMSVATKQYGTDTQPVIDGLMKAIDEIRQFLPSSVELRPFFNQEELITVSIQNLREALLIGGLAVLVVVILFLANLRTTFIIAVTLPISVMITFIFMEIFHVTLNVMSLGGIAVGLGIMIDAAIVDTENIFRWIRLHPDDSFFATLRGAVEVRRPVAYSTAIIIAVFAPLMFLTGFEGKLFLLFAFTIIVSMLVGFGLSLTLTPLVCYTLLGRGNVIARSPVNNGTTKQSGTAKNNQIASPPSADRNEGKRESWLTRKFLHLYEPVLNRSLRNPLRTVLLVTAILALTLGLIPFIGTELLPPFDENAILLKIWMPPGTSLDESSKVTNQILSVAKDAPDVRDIIATVGRPEGSEMTEGMIGFSENYIELVDRRRRTKSIQEIEKWIREKTAGFPGAVVTFQTPLNDRIEESISGTTGQLAVKIFGPDYDILAQKANQMKEIMEKIPGVTDLFMEQTSGLPLLNILIDRNQAGRYGLSPEMIGSVVETAMQGRTATTVLRDVKEFKVFVRLQERFRNDPAKVGSILIDTPSGAKVKLSQVAQIWEDTGPMLIKRENLRRRIQLTCNISGGDIQSVVSRIRSKLGEMNLPPGSTVSFGGNYERQQELNRQILTMIIISLLVVFMLLLAAFNSAWQAVLIIFTIPLALMGGVWAMFVTVTTFNVSSLIGFVAHFGLTVQKGVILVEYINDLRKEGMPLAEALVVAGKTRMRPVLMTAFAASLGVLPLALGIGAGAEIQQPMAIVLIGGLIISTPIVLVVLPMLYGQMARIFERRSVA